MHKFTCTIWFTKLRLYFISACADLRLKAHAGSFSRRAKPRFDYAVWCVFRPAFMQVIKSCWRGRQGCCVSGFICCCPWDQLTPKLTCPPISLTPHSHLLFLSFYFRSSLIFVFFSPSDSISLFYYGCVFLHFTSFFPLSVLPSGRATVLSGICWIWWA